MTSLLEEGLREGPTLPEHLKFVMSEVNDKDAQSVPQAHPPIDGWRMAVDWRVSFPLRREKVIQKLALVVVQTIRTCKEVGHDGLSRPDHLPSIENDEGRQAGVCMVLRLSPGVDSVVYAAGVRNPDTVPSNYANSRSSTGSISSKVRFSPAMPQTKR